MRNDVDTNELRRLARGFGDTIVARDLSRAADNIDDLRAGLASLDPPPAMRLAMYRQGIAAGVYSRMAMGQGMVGNIEEEAHAMLAAERVSK